MVSSVASKDVLGMNSLARLGLSVWSLHAPRVLMLDIDW